MIESKMVSNDVREMVKHGHGEDILDLMDKISDLNEKYDFNILVIVNKPYVNNSLATMYFSQFHCVDIQSGIPKIDLQKYAILNKEDKLKELKALMSTCYGFIESINSLMNGFVSFSDQLQRMEKLL